MENIQDETIEEIDEDIDIFEDGESEAFPMGSLLQYRDIDSKDRELMIALLSDKNKSKDKENNSDSYLFKVLFNVIEDDYLVIELADIFAGKKISFPSRKKLYKLLEKIRIYKFVKNRNYSESAYILLSKKYKKRINQLKSCVTRIDYLLEGGNPLIKDEESDDD